MKTLDKFIEKARQEFTDHFTAYTPKGDKDHFEGNNPLREMVWEFLEQKMKESYKLGQKKK